MKDMSAKAFFITVFLCIGFISNSSLGAGFHTQYRAKTHHTFKKDTLVPRVKHGNRLAANTKAATWRMPWQIRPILSGRRGRSERIVEARVRKTGRVRGTLAAIATVGRKLRAVAGPNRTVKACRATVARAARKLGAREVEAVSAGRERRTATGNFVAPVQFRITYRRQKIYEVRLSSLNCIVSPGGKLIDAFVLQARR